MGRRILGAGYEAVVVVGGEPLIAFAVMLDYN